MNRRQALNFSTVASLLWLAMPVAPGLAQSSQPAAPPAAKPPQSVTREAVEGIWIDDTGDGAIEITSCGTRLCGRIVWLKSPLDARGRPLTDGYNPKAAERNRPICGLQVMGDLKRMGGGRWDEGWIYDPKEGKSYDVEVRPEGQNRIRVTGYLGVRFLSESFVWTRAPADIKLCAAP